LVRSQRPFRPRLFVSGPNAARHGDCNCRSKARRSSLPRLGRSHFDWSDGHGNHRLAQSQSIAERETKSLVGNAMPRFRLRTLMILLAVGPILLAGLLLYGDRTWNEILRWWIRQP